MAENYFKELYSIDMSKDVKAKNGLSYAPWAKVWGKVKSIYPDAFYTIYKQMFTITKTTEGKEVITQIERPWFDDERTGWVRTGVTINGIEHVEDLPILDFKNKPISADAITSADANKAIQRCITKACARHGCSLHVYEGEEFSEEIKELEKFRAECWKLFCERAKISADAKAKANELCKNADSSGDPREIDDIEILKQLKKDLMAIRK